MHISLIISSILHGALIFITAMSLPFLAKKPIDIPPIVSVELIQIAEKTNIPFAPKAKKIIEKKKKKKLKEKEKKLVSKLAPPKKKKLVSGEVPPKKVKNTQSKTVVSLDKKKEKIKNQNPDAVPPLEKKIKTIETKKEDKQNPVKTFKNEEPIKQKKDKQNPEKADNLVKQSSEFNKKIVDEDELQKIIDMAKEDKIDKLKENDKPTQDQDESVGIPERLTFTQEQALQAQIEGCWTAPIYTEYLPEDLKVRIKLHLNSDRTIKDMEMLDHVKMNTKGKEKFRALAESVKRAFQRDMCKTLNLPNANYEKWKIIQFNFDASVMIGE